MTSEVKRAEAKKLVHISALFLVRRHPVSAEAGPVTSTVDPAEIRGLGTT
jgi:hypothetical protein